MVAMSSMPSLPSLPAVILPDRTDGNAVRCTAVRRDDTVCARAMKKVQFSKRIEMPLL